MELHANLIDGEWVEGEAVPNVNPANTAEVVGHYARATAADAARAIAAAKAAFPAWSRSGPLRAPRRAVEGRRRDPRAQGGARHACSAARRARRSPRASARRSAPRRSSTSSPASACGSTGEILPSVRPGVGVEITREAVGPVGLITPWNFPIAIPAWKIAPALAYGNTVVIKPADLVPGCTWALVDILHRAGLPKGVLNLVMGKRLGGRPGDPRQPATSARSASPARSAPAGASPRRAIKVMRKFQLEMGGKNPMVVLDDADLEVAVEACLNGAFYSTGQRCTASSRLIVQRRHPRPLRRAAAPSGWRR